MAGESKQKWVGRNRAPRVQIEYETEINGAQRKVDLAHIMGVMSDLSGKSKVEKPDVRERKFEEIDVDNFDKRMRAIKPRAAFYVDNVLTDEGGKVAVDLEFESMDDFSPAAVAKKVGGVKELLEARQQLKNLMSYMDGKANAEEWLAGVLKDEALLKAVMSTNKPAVETNADTTEPESKE